MVLWKEQHLEVLRVEYLDLLKVKSKVQRMVGQLDLRLDQLKVVVTGKHLEDQLELWMDVLKVHDLEIHLDSQLEISWLDF